MPSTKKPSELSDNNSVAESYVNEPRKKRRAVYYTSNVPDSLIRDASERQELVQLMQQAQQLQQAQQQQGEEVVQQ